MRIAYTLKPQKEVLLKNDKHLQNIFEVDQAEIEIVSEQGIIKEFKIYFKKVDYHLNPLEGQSRIVLHIDEIHYILYTLCSYISNRLLAESNIDAIDCTSYFDNVNPEIFPETPEEQEDVRNAKLAQMTIFRMPYSISDYAGLVEFEQGYRYEKAYAAYADGKRANSVFTKYTQYWKAIDALLGEEEIYLEKLHERVYAYDDSIGSDDIDQLRKIRNRCEHPKPRNGLGHLSSSDIRHIKEVEENLNALQHIVEILFKHNVGEESA